MEKRIKIGDFIKLTGSTLKTVIYYHKIGLLREPERSAGGYRLYGPAELSRMQSIKQLKSLGLDLKRTKEVLGDMHNSKTLREVLLSLQAELSSEKKIIEERMAKIEEVLSEDTVGEDRLASPSFQMIAEILGPEQIENYARTCPELFRQHRKVYSLLDDFQWGEDYQETFRALAEFFKKHPEQYRISLDYGARLARLAHMPADDPEVEALARESAEFIKNIPQLKDILGRQAGMKKAHAALYNDMVANATSSAQVRYGQLLKEFISSGN